ncbi:hypothetical protein Cgig2_029220 [Carnegiea gigantea]|uniref:Uncharacterized protein n=1 Tax=Carnegiea gigantea TaxID=171969 RepID=A0A9Q1JNC1_9CARY|nr:hypothetical protein Cgig2_029220 [Carnegiea gigantea]
MEDEEGNMKEERRMKHSPVLGLGFPLSSSKIGFSSSSIQIGITWGGRRGNGRESEGRANLGNRESIVKEEEEEDDDDDDDDDDDEEEESKPGLKYHPIKGRVLGHGHADYAETMFHLGTVLCLQGNLKDAEVLIQDSIRILEEGGQGESYACIRKLRCLAQSLVLLLRRKELQDNLERHHALVHWNPKQIVPFTSPEGRHRAVDDISAACLQIYSKSNNRLEEAENVQRKILHIMELTKSI